MSIGGVVVEVFIFIFLLTGAGSLSRSSIRTSNSFLHTYSWWAFRALRVDSMAPSANWDSGLLLRQDILWPRLVGLSGHRLSSIRSP